MAVLEFEVDGGVAKIVLNRPEAKNSLNRELAQRLAAALAEASRRDDVRVAVIAGAGGTFCAGMDLKAFAAGEDIPLDGLPIGHPLQALISKPVIAAVEGYAIGAGFEFALASDLIVVGESARFALPEVKRGLVAGGGGLMRLPRQIPVRRAVELVLTGKMVDAATLSGWGLVNAVVPEGTALDAAMELARSIAENAPMAVAASVRIMRESRSWTEEEMFARQRPLIDPVFASADAHEGARAFAEKRAPNWTGR